MGVQVHSSNTHFRRGGKKLEHISVKLPRYTTGAENFAGDDSRTMLQVVGYIVILMGTQIAYWLPSGLNGLGLLWEQQLYLRPH